MTTNLERISSSVFLMEHEVVVTVAGHLTCQSAVVDSPTQLLGLDRLKHMLQGV